MVKSSRIYRSKRTKVLTWILPLYALVFFVYATFGSKEHRNTRVTRDNILHNVEAWTNNDGSEFQRHLLSTERNCTPAAINEFPEDFFTQDQRARGGVVIHFIISIYLFYALAIICDDYFVPSLECICDVLDMPTDVAGATFMAMGTSAPELFTSVIGSFVTEGDIGVGTIVGSAVFNILAVLSVCGLLAGVNEVVPLDWWPLTRDSIAYLITVITLIIVITDQSVEWYEGAIMIGLYLLYILVMVFNSRLERFATRIVDACRRKPKNFVESASSEHSPLLTDDHSGSHALSNGHSESEKKAVDNGYSVPIKEADDDDDEDWSLFSMPHKGVFKQISWVLMWPAHFVFYFTIPNCRKPRWKRWFMLTFAVSIMYIGSLSYIIAWMVTVIGYTIGVPDSVMGLTFLAAGTSVPEAISSVIVCRQGYGNMAVSNILGSNIFDILFCLGAPWIIKAAAFSDSSSVIINSGGIEYSAISLLTTVVFLYAAVIINKFKLDKKLGWSCLVTYIIFLIFSNLFELNVFGMVNLPTCLPEK